MNSNGQKPHTVKQVAKLSGVSVRTLRFYDELGLLNPAFYGENGYRYYEQDQLLILQQILFYRELGIELTKIKEIIANPNFDKVEALRSHREQLVKGAERTAMLIRTIDNTLAHLKMEAPMKADEIYKGFDTKRLNEYVEWTRNRFGDEAAASYRKSMLDWKAKNPNWSDEEYEEVKRSYDELYACFKILLEKGLSTNSEQTQDLVERHYKVVRQFWTPDRKSYTALGQIYREHPDYRKLYDAYHPQLADYLAEAMRVFAGRKLQ